MNDSWLQEIQEILTTYPDTPFVLVGAVALIFVLWLILRSAKLWYWKVNDRSETLEHISETLDEIRSELCGAAEEAAKNRSQMPPQPQPQTSAQPTVLVQSGSATVLVQQPATQTAQVEQAAQTAQYVPQQAYSSEQASLQPQQAAEVQAAKPIADVMPEQNRQDTEFRPLKYMTRDCNRDKTGKVYTREEIEASIKA